jgi:glycosyltransferase involved in cell wall biosynthesis
MTTRDSFRLLYLGFAFPPGVQGRFPGANPAGHRFETEMISALRRHFEIRSVGLLPFEIIGEFCQGDAADGLDHELVLVEKPPELFYRWRALARLQRKYLEWAATGWVPAAVLVYNLSVVYNQFIRWLGKQRGCPTRVLLLADSPRLGEKLPRWKRLRHRLKPMFIPDADALLLFDACIGLSQGTERYFAERKLPWLWMPGGCEAISIPAGGEREAAPPIAFGYFGALASHAGVMPLIENFLACPLPNALHICGYGKLAESIQRLAGQHERLRFHGLLPTPADCLTFAQSVDVLVNPRPLSHGNQNNFPSKLFQYALSGRAILTTRFSGIDAVLGEDAFYFDETRFDSSLRQAIGQIAGMPRLELRRRGEAIRQRIASEFSWGRQATKIAGFIKQLKRQESGLEEIERSLL